MALILLPVVAAVGFMALTTIHNPSLSSALGTLAFAILAFGVFGKVLSMARQWENESL